MAHLKENFGITGVMERLRKTELDGETSNAYKILVRKPGKRPFRRPKMKWKSQIKMDLTEVCYEYGRWLELAQGRVQ